MTTNPTKGPEQIGAVATRAVEAIRDRMADPEKYRPISVGLGKKMDEAIGGIVIPSYVAIGGPSKMGKTAVAVTIAKALSKNMRTKVIAFHLEEKKEQYAIRAMTSMAFVGDPNNAVKMTADRKKIRDLTLEAGEVGQLDAAAQDLANYDLWVEDEMYNIDAILATAVKEQAKVIILDTFNLVEGGNARDEYLRLENISRIILKARNTQEFTVIVIYQLNDKGKAYGTRAAYRDADLIIELEDNLDDVSEDPIPGTLLLHVLPSRQAPESFIPIGFDGAASRAYELPPTIASTVATHVIQDSYLEAPDEYIESK